MNIETLTQTAQKSILEIALDLVSCKNLQNLEKITQRFEELIECEYLIFGFPNYVNGNLLDLTEINISFPQSWVDEYQKNQYWKIDPVVRACIKQEGALHWTDIFSQYKSDKEFIDLASDYGLQFGYTCLTRDLFDQDGLIVSVGGKYQNYDYNVSSCLANLSPFFDIAFKSIRKVDEAEKIATLTKKEKEVLKWLYVGKTSWEISIIQNVSESTINFHILNVKRKLKVASRIQAVVKAMHGGLIN